jgi:hypothetical protein
MDKSLEKYRSLYILVKDETKKDLFGPAGFFGPLGTDHKALKIFADWIREKKKENGGVLTQNQINSHTFIAELEKKPENKDLVAKIKGLHLIQTEQIQNNTLFRFAKVIKALGMVDQEGKSIGLYEEALKKIASMQPLQAQKTVEKVEPKTSVKPAKSVKAEAPVSATATGTTTSATPTGVISSSEVKPATATANATPAGVVTSSEVKPATATTSVTPTGVVTSSDVKPATATTSATPAGVVASSEVKPATTASVTGTIESKETETVQQQNPNQDATVGTNTSEVSATPEAKKTEIPNLKSTLDISGKKVEGSEIPNELNLSRNLKIATMGSEEAAIDNERIRNNVNTMGGLLSIPRAPTRSPVIQGVSLPSHNRKVRRLHGNRRMKSPAKKGDPLKIQDAKPVNRQTPATQAQQAQQAQTRGLEDQEYDEQLRQNLLNNQAAQQEYDGGGSQSKSSKLKKTLIGGGIASAVGAGGFFGSIIIPDEETTANAATFIATHTVTTFKSIISIIHLFIK